MKIISSNAKRLSSLINDILDYSKMKNNELSMNKTDVNIKKVSSHAINITRPMIDAKKLKLYDNIPDNLPPVFADEIRLEQIFLNLVGNAIKFTDTGRIEIFAEQSGNMIEVTVMDSGIGIPENKFEEIFMLFQQIDMTSTRKYGGTGIGLSITKKLVELHGGNIRLESKIGKGSRFIFTIPVSVMKNITS